MTPEALEMSKKYAARVLELEAQVVPLTAERDEWKAEALYLRGLSAKTVAGRALAAAQARLKDLSSVLEGVEIPFNLHEKIRYLLRETP